MRSQIAIAPALTVVAVLMAAGVWLQVVRDRRFGTDRPADQILYVQSPEVVDRLVLSYDALAADVYWIRALQVVGGAGRRGHPPARFELLHPLLDMATSLDPYFNIAYRFGATFLSQGPPVGPGRPDLAVMLLEKGLRHQPHKWQYMQDAGFVYYWTKQDYVAAAEWFERGSRVPGAPDFLKPLAAVTLAQGGRREASRMIFRGLVATAADNTWTRQDAERRLRQLDAMDQMDYLRRVTAAYRARGGAIPMTWASLARAGYLRGIPQDPDGFVYELGPWSGDVSMHHESTLLPLPVEKPPSDSLTQAPPA